MTRTGPALRSRSSLLADLRIIVLGSYGFILQLFFSWRLTPKLPVQPNDHQRNP